MATGKTTIPQRLLQVLHATGLEPVLGAEDPGKSGGPALVLFDGKLQPEHGAWLRREPAVLLLAQTPDDLRPTASELSLLRALLSRRSLIEGVLWELNARVSDMAALLELSRQVGALAGDAAGVAADVAYELLVNAMLDAPADGNGEPRYAHRRAEVKEVAAEDACELRAMTSGKSLIIIVRDRFGRLTPEPVARTIEGLGGKARVDSSGGGAGLGMRRIVEQTDTLGFRVVAGRMTEVFCALDLGGSRRRGQPKSLFFLRE